MRTLRSAAGIAAGAMLVGGTLAVATAAGGGPGDGDSLWAEFAVAHRDPAFGPAIVGTPVVAEEPPPPRSADDAGLAETLAALRQCESDDHYGIDTGNGYYGAYQFEPSTWWGLGYGGFPDEAPPEVQDEAAVALQERSGWAPWPACASQLGLL